MKNSEQFTQNLENIQVFSHSVLKTKHKNEIFSGNYSEDTKKLLTCTSQRKKVANYNSNFSTCVFIFLGLSICYSIK